MGSMTSGSSPGMGETFVSSLKGPHSLILKEYWGGDEPPPSLHPFTVLTGGDLPLFENFVRREILINCRKEHAELPTSEM